MKLLKSVQPACCAPTPLLYRKYQRSSSICLRLTVNTLWLLPKVLLQELPESVYLEYTMGFFKIFLNTFRILSFLDSDHLYPCKTYVLMGHIYICMCGLRCNLVLHSCKLLSYKIRPCAGPKGNVSFRNTYLFSLLCIGKGMVKLDSYNIVTVAEFIFPLFSISFLTSLSFQKDSEIWREKNKNK